MPDLARRFPISLRMAPAGQRIRNDYHWRYQLPRLALILLALAGATAHAQVPAVSIAQLASDITANNPERRFLATEIDLARQGARAAGRLADPEVSVEFGERRANNAATGAPLGDGPIFSVSVVQPIEFGGRPALRRAIAEGNVRLARIGLAQFDATLAARARTLGYRLFAAGERASAAAAVAARLRALARVLVARDPAGPTPRLEAAVLEAAAITAERNAAQADADQNAVLYELNALRGVALDSRLRITRPALDLPPLPPAPALTDQAETGNFELLALKEQLGQQGLSVSLARRSRIGQVAIGPFYSRGRGDIVEQEAGVRATTTLPLWNRQAGEVSAAETRQAQGEAAVLAARRRIALAIQTQASVYAARGAALAKWAPDAPERFARAAADADAAYRLGGVPVATYVQMQTGYLDALAAVLDTRAGAYEALEQLKVLTGSDLVP